MFYRSIAFLLMSITTLYSGERILGVGAATIDLLIPVDDQFLLSHFPEMKGGSNGFDLEMIERILLESNTPAKIVVGGSAANTVRALTRMGEMCAFYTHIGMDEYGERFSHHMRSLGIEERFNRSPDFATSRVLCLITPDGQRTFIAYDQRITDSTLCNEDFHNLKWVHIEARQLKSGISVEKVMHMSRENGAKVSLDLSNFELARDFKDVLLHLIPNYVEIVFCNEDEITALTGLSPEEGCLELQKLCPVVVVTKGPNGCLVGHANTLLAIPTFPATPIDTTGAGDLFASGFLYGYLRGYPLATCAQIGNRLGSAVVEVIGAELPEEQWEKIHTFMVSLEQSYPLHE